MIPLPFPSSNFVGSNSFDRGRLKPPLHLIFVVGLK